MVLLDVDFNEGDILTAGVVTSTSSVNGITTTINSNTLIKLKYVNSDLTGGTYENSTNETEIGTASITAGTITTGVIITATGFSKSDSGGERQNTVRLKTGTDGSETEKTSMAFDTYRGTSNSWTLQWYESSLNWAAAQSVSITGQSSISANGTGSTCDTIMIIGY